MWCCASPGSFAAGRSPTTSCAPAAPSRWRASRATAPRRGGSGSRRSAASPSTVGGAVVMNAGCYGSEIRDVLIEARVMDRAGRARAGRRRRPGRRLPEHPVCRAAATSCWRRASACRRATRRPRWPAIEELNRRRWQSLPSGVPNAGSVFRNPEGQPAGRLIEETGLKGERRGGAQISPKHANVIVNLGGARADEVLELMVLARRSGGGALRGGSAAGDRARGWAPCALRRGSRCVVGAPVRRFAGHARTLRRRPGLQREGHRRDAASARARGAVPPRGSTRRSSSSTTGRATARSRCCGGSRRTRPSASASSSRRRTRARAPR